MKQNNMNINQTKTITKRQWINFLLFWQRGAYNGSAFSPISGIVNRYFCWIDRHAYIIPFSVKKIEDKLEITLKCKHCGHEDYFTRDIEELNKK